MKASAPCTADILATEARSLPPQVANAARGYFIACNEWLARAFGKAGVAESKRRAMEVTALLQGAMLQAVSLDDAGTFEKAVKELRQSFT